MFQIAKFLPENKKGFRQILRSFAQASATSDTKPATRIGVRNLDTIFQKRPERLAQKGKTDKISIWKVSYSSLDGCGAK